MIYSNCTSIARGRHTRLDHQHDLGQTSSYSAWLWLCPLHLVQVKFKTMMHSRDHIYDLYILSLCTATCSWLCLHVVRWDTMKGVRARLQPVWG